MSTPTVARTNRSEASHYYRPDGTACYEVPKADGKGMRRSTIADARKLGLLPSATTILKLLHKEALVQWLVEQSVLAAVTTPRLPDEKDDAFIFRILHVEKVQDEESQIARDKGTQIHAAFEDYFSGREVPADLQPIVRPAIETIIAFGQRASSEVIVVGEGFAGRTDLIQDCEGCWRIWDIKTTKKLPDPQKGGAYAEHKLQLSAYAKAWADKLEKAGALNKPIIVGNVYVSTTTPGEFVICEHEDWETTFEKGFRPLLVHWMWANNYWPVELSVPQPPKASVPAPAPAPVAEPAPAPIASANTLPTQTPDGRKIQWSTATASAPKNP